MLTRHCRLWMTGNLVRD